MIALILAAAFAAPAQPWTQTASIYAHRFDGHRAADGSRYRASALTCAISTPPLGTRVRVRHDGWSVTGTVTDRTARRIHRIDLSPEMARRLHVQGLADVVVEVAEAVEGKKGRK